MVNLFRKEPSVDKEICIQKKRLKTLEALEKSLASFVTEVKAIQIDCPFGSESVETQAVVTEALNWCTAFNGHLTQVFNLVVSRHHEDIDILHTSIVSSESLEDTFAVLKTHVTDELKASAEVRAQDKTREGIFLDKLAALQIEYLSKMHSTANTQNSNSEHYSLVD